MNVPLLVLVSYKWQVFDAGDAHEPIIRLESRRLGLRRFAKNQRVLFLAARMLQFSGQIGPWSLISGSAVREAGENVLGS
jgi:hypothetical protein